MTPSGNVRTPCAAKLRMIVAQDGRAATSAAEFGASRADIAREHGRDPVREAEVLVVGQPCEGRGGRRDRGIRIGHPSSSA